MLRIIRGKGDGCGISGFAVNRGAGNQGFNVLIMISIARKVTWCPSSK